MRILVFNWRDLKHEWSGGSEVYITELAKRWVKLGHTVTLFCGQGLENNLPTEEVLDGIKIIRRGGKYSLYLWAPFYYLTHLRSSFDLIVDAQNGIPFFSTVFARIPVVAIVHHVHGKQFFVELPTPFNLIGYCVERFLFPVFYRNTRIIAVSKTTKEKLVDSGLPEKNISVIYNGVNFLGNSGARHEFVHPTILYLGRIKIYKRVHLLIELMPKIISKIPNVRLLIAGWGTEGAFVTDISMKKGLRKKVKILGPVSDAERNRLFSKAWLFVNPSMAEGWGISVIEANFFGTPAVAYNVPGFSESIRDGETGLLAANDETFVAAIVKILSDRALRNKFSNNARKWSAKFDWEKSARESLTILQELTR